MDTTMAIVPRYSRCYRAYRRAELIFLGLLFIALSILFYQVITTDHVTVMSWFGVKVNTRLNQPRQKLTSKVEQKDFSKHKHFLLNQGSKSGDDVQEGLVVDPLGGSESFNSEKEILTIAIGCAITSRGLKDLSMDTVGQISPFLRTFLPSFCKTTNSGYNGAQNQQNTNKDGKGDANHIQYGRKYIYKMYLAYDSVDPFFSDMPFKRAFRRAFEGITTKLCHAEAEIKLYFVRCPYTKRPAWSQNDAMFTAYLADADYYFRVNDDTMLITNNWQNILIETLNNLKPPNIGVVGPAHKGGNEIIISQDFVHKTHLDIFGFYYPRTFQTWWADDWISGVYGHERTQKVDWVRVIHTSEQGTRYNHTWSSPTVLSDRLKEDRVTLQSFLSKGPSDLPLTFPKGKKVISMSLYGDDPKYTYGAVRNAVLSKRIFPGWTFRIYIEKVKDDGSTTYQPTSKLIINKLKAVGAEIVYVDSATIKVPPMMWRYLVADDPDVDYFIIRDTDSRLIMRDAEVVSEWLMESQQPFHCVRDHPSHRSSPLFGGLIGGRSRQLREVIREQWRGLMNSYAEDYGMDIIFLSNTIWSRVKDHTLCHDSITCRQWGPSHAWPFPSPRLAYEHVGQVVDAYGETRGIDIDLLKLYPEPWECTLRDGESLQSWLTKQKANARAEAAALEASKKRGKNARQSLVQSELEEEHLRRNEAKIPSLVGKVVIWTMDYDADYVRSLKSLLEPRGVIFIDKSLSPDCRLFGSCPHNLTVVTPENGRDLDVQVAEKFYTSYKNDPEMNQVTHFLCFRPVAMCELYAPFKKSVIAIATRRYEEGRLIPSRWQQLNTNLTNLQAESRNIIGANNHYDIEYMRYFTGFDPEYLPSYCAYADTVTSNTTKPQYLVARISNNEFRVWFLDALQKMLKKVNSKVKVVYVDDLYPQGHSLSDLLGHAGIIHVPEKVSDIRVCEQYRMSIPLYFPSLELITKWHKQYNLLSNRTFFQERLHKHGISISGSPIRAAAMGRYDPNDEISTMSLRYWVRFADFLHLPHVGHFDNLEDLTDQLQGATPRVTSVEMTRFNRRFKREMVSKWINLINRTLM